MWELWQDKNHQDKTVYRYNTHIWQPSWCCSILSIMSLNWYKCFILSCYVTTDYLVFTCVHAFLIQMLHTVMLCYHWLLSIHMCTCLFVFPGIGQGLSLDRAVIPGKYRPGIPRTYKPTNVHTRTCTWYLYLYLVCQYLMYLSTWLVKIQSTCTCTCTWLWVLEVLEYLTNCTWPQPWTWPSSILSKYYKLIHIHNRNNCAKF